MAGPQRDQVLDKIVEKLKTVSQENGNYTSPALVTRQFQLITQYNEFPILTVTEGPGPVLQRTIQDMFEHQFKVTIWGYVKSDDVKIRSQWLQELWADVVKTVINNSTLDNLVSDVTIDPGLETDEGTWEPLGAFAQDLTVMFHESIAA